MEQAVAHSLSAGYLKGAEQAGAGSRIMLNVMTTFGSASKQLTLYALHSGMYMNVKCRYYISETLSLARGKFGFQ